MAWCCDPKEEELLLCEVKLAAERITKDDDEDEGEEEEAACPFEEKSCCCCCGGGRCCEGEERAAEAKALPEVPAPPLPPPKNALLERSVAPRSRTAAPAEAQWEEASFFFSLGGVILPARGKDGGLRKKEELKIIRLSQLAQEALLFPADFSTNVLERERKRA
jgi:hypothetical protein